ncbi:MAG: hypothetical protein IJ475_00965 [Bacilli bacterium]|nr:hypothetical protein [Bacilli bacterium]
MKKKDKIFILLAILIVVAVFTWILPVGVYGTVNEATSLSTESGIMRLGIIELLYIIPFAINYAGNDIIYLFIIGGLYGVLSKTRAYRKLVSNTVKLIRGKENIAMLVTTFLMGLYVSLSSNIMSLLWIAPFIVTVFLKRGKDRLTAISAGFGGLFIGTIGLTFGTYGIETLNTAMSLSVTDGILYKVILFIAAYILFNLFAIMHMNKQEDVVNEVSYDAFATAKLTEAESKKKTLMWPTIVVLCIGLLFALLGYIDWAGSFNITFFDELHNNLNSFYIGDLPIFKNLFSGENMYSVTSLGTWVDMLPFSFILLVISFVVALVNKMSFSEYIDNFSKGIVSISRIVFVYVILIAILVIVGIFTWPLTIIDKFLPDTFNLFGLLITAILIGIFYCDQGIGYSLFSAVLAERFANNLVATSIITHFGFAIVQVIAPTSIILMMALSHLDVSYKSWLSYIWKFVLSMILVFVLIMAIVCYM